MMVLICMMNNARLGLNFALTFKSNRIRSLRSQHLARMFATGSPWLEKPVFLEFIDLFIEEIGADMLNASDSNYLQSGH